MAKLTYFDNQIFNDLYGVWEVTLQKTYFARKASKYICHLKDRTIDENYLEQQRGRMNKSLFYKATQSDEN